MKLTEVLHMGGFETMISPGTHINQQVVQPRTIQADNPEQMGPGYEKEKNKQKEQKKIELELYNAHDIDYIKDPYEEPEELNKKIKKTIFAIDNKVIADISLGYNEFAKKLDKETEEKPKQSRRKPQE